MRDAAELTSAYFDDELVDGELLQLRDWINADRSHLQQFVRDSLVHSRIRDLLHEREVRSLFAEGADEQGWIDPHHIVSLLEEEAAIAERRAREAEELARQEALATARRRELELDRKSLRVEPERIPRRWYAAAVLAASLLLAMAWQLSEPSLVQEKPRTAARPVAPPIVGAITHSLEARWENPELAVADGTPIRSGILSLESGVVEIKLNSGAQLVIEAPASLDFVSSDRVQLNRGRVVANVPPQAVGFTLRSKAASFVDLGTEFGVEISETGAASIHVLDGEVALVRGNRASAEPSRMLQVGAASRVSADGATVVDIPFEASRFFRRVPATAYELAVRQSRPLAYWRMSETADAGELTSEGRIAVPGQPAAGVQLGGEGYGSGSGAAFFAREHGGVELGRVTELGLVTNFTCEAWARPTARSRHENGVGPQRILSTFDRMPRTGFAFGLVDGRWYDLPQAGLLLHVTAHGVYDCVSTASTPTDEWVHLAAVVDASGEPTLYLNSQPSSPLCRPSVGSEQERWTRLDDWSSRIGTPGAGRALLGRNPLGADGQSPPERFEGWLSDVAVYDRALPAEEIGRHFRAAQSEP